MSNAKHVTDDSFEQDVLKSDKPVLVDFWAPWCGPCKMISPILDKIANETSTISVVKVNVDDNPATAEKYEIRSIPALFIFKDGQIVSQLLGANPEKKILDWIESKI